MGSTPITRSNFVTKFELGSPIGRPALHMYYIYILQSQKDKRTYVGYTKDFEERLKKHNSGQVRSTKYRRLFKLLKLEKIENMAEAKRRELWWKSGRGRIEFKKLFSNL